MNETTVYAIDQLAFEWTKAKNAEMYANLSRIEIEKKYWLFSNRKRKEPSQKIRTSTRMRCDVCGKPIFRAHTIITGSTLEAWCHTCFEAFRPEDSRIFDPENESWEVKDDPP